MIKKRPLVSVRQTLLFVYKTHFWCFFATFFGGGGAQNVTICLKNTFWMIFRRVWGRAPGCRYNLLRFLRL